MKREILRKLQEWKVAKYRKPLILKGVRQCGKTFMLQEFGNQAFSQCHYINFELNPGLSTLFAADLNPERIVSDLSFTLNAPIDVHTDLLIFDEIQVCPLALTSLKYFSEKMPEAAVCTAGSLLGVQLNEGSFPVGKVDLLHMYPMSFTEFLQAIGDERAYDYLREEGSKRPAPALIHQHLWERLKWYFIVGGLPEVVRVFCDNRDNLFTAFTKVREKQRELTYSYYADITKHAGKVNAMHIDRVWQAVPSQLSKNHEEGAKRFQFKGIIKNIDRYSRLANVIDWLLAAGLVIKVPIVSHAEIPLPAYTEESHFKLFMFDIGMLGSMIELPPKAILDYDYGTYKGYFAENYFAQAWQVNENYSPLHGWQEGRSEVEFLTLLHEELIPIEIKSGNITRAKSLQKYIDKYHPAYSLKLSANPLHIDTVSKIHHYPLYMANLISGGDE